MLGPHVVESGTEVVAHFLKLIEQPVEGAQKFDCDGAGQRSSTERGSVHAGMHSAGDPVSSEQRPQRQACCQRFRDSEDVRLNTVVLVGKIASGTAQAALDLIQDQQRTGAVRQLARDLKELWSERTNSTFTLNRLQTNGTDAAVELSLEIFNVIEGNKTDARHQRREGVTILFLTGRRERTESAAVK